MTYTTAELNQTGIYAIINRDNGKAYIGSTAESFRKRWNKHKASLRLCKHHSPVLQKAWNKYTEFRFEFRILEVVPKEEFTDNKYLTDIEQVYLDTYNPEYNILKIAGSCLGRKHGEEAKVKLSQSMKGKTPWNIGIPRTDEVKEKLRQANLGKGQIHALNTPAAKAKSIESRISKLEEHTLISPEEVEYTFKSIRAFCKVWNLQQSHVTQLLKGKQKVHKGWRVKI
ncbi:GIY-YIG nuclease family protein [Nostoc sp. ChiSLP03a]|uniref:GIY-YIG nuclease family protein n=1 Tax=Nostoc sp. ChiSLP03a TaxID=3075380 RepID=UPI002AD36410|nr:GIY-YIG nuclease family protein [Nostoc sp. ChiSLP03a]MDZ8215059.1 GIY-YIG nuclease family protein [Nostoc sp. ChiSLP03a]